MRTSISRSGCALVCAAFLATLSGPVQAGKPTKPGGGSGSDPCDDPGIDFPAFIYWQQSSTEQEIFVTDAEGKCSRSVIVLTNGAASGAAFSYPVTETENVGRIAWYNWALDSIDWLDVVVDQTDHTINVGSVNSTPVGVDAINIDLTKDGRTVYFGTGARDLNQSGSVWKVTLEDSDPGPVLVRDAPPSTNALSYFTVSVSADESILVLEESDLFGVPETHRLVRFCVTGGACDETLVEIAHQGFPAVSAGGDVTAYSNYQDGSNNCWLLTYVDAGGESLYSGTQPRYGRNASWLGDKVLVNGRKPPDRRNKCAATDSIVKIDPTTGEEVTLVRGYDPDAR